MRFPDILQSFKFFLQSKKTSPLSIRNYLSDLNNFLSWLAPFLKSQNINILEDFDLRFFKSLSTEVINQYKKYLVDNKIPNSTINRRFSTLRKFAQFCLTQNWADQNFAENLTNVSKITRLISPPLVNFEEILDRFAKKLVTEKNSRVTVINYLVDIKNFLFWLSRVTSDSTKEALGKITPLVIAEYQDRLLKITKLSPRSINRKISSLRRFCQFAKDQGYLAKNPFERQPIRTAIKWPEIGKIGLFKRPSLKFGIPKKIFAPQEVSRKGWSLHQKILFHLRYTRPNWYVSYCETPLANYFHWAILIIFSAGIGFGLYQQWILQPPKRPKLAVGPAPPPLYLSFQGRLTDTTDTPIASPTWFTFAIYDSDTASGAARLWNETKRLTPNQDGIFNTLLGDTTAISSSIFKNNTALWLGVTVENNPEMANRQQIATVAYAFNAEFLKGYPVASLTNIDPAATAGAQINTIPIINPFGNLIIAASSPSIRSTSGSFTLQGETMYLTTEPSQSGAININPGGTGTVNFFTANPTGNALNATSSALTSGTLIYGGVANDEPGFKLLQLQAGSTLTDKFTIDAWGATEIANNLGVAGSATIAGSLKVGGANFFVDSSGAVTFGIWKGTAIATQYGGTGQDWSGVAQGSIPYFSGTGTMTTLAPGTSGYVLMTQGAGANPTWTDSAGLGTNYWDLANGSLYPKNSTVDLLIGGTATTSAKFGFLNVNSGTPVASFSGVLTLNNSSTNYINSLGGQALSFRTSVGGDTGLTDRLYIANNGNVGIGTTHPSTKLEIFDGALCVDDGTSSCPTNGTPGYIYAESTSITEIDLAENYPTLDTSLEAGELVSVNPEKNESVTRSLRAYDSKLLGVISTKPGILLGGQCNDPTGCQELQVPVALAGRIPIKVSDINGPIKNGDPITSSEIPGVGMKATQAGSIVGKALESFDPSIHQLADSGEVIPCPDGTPGGVTCGRILAFVNVSWTDPTVYLTKAGEIEINNPNLSYNGLLIENRASATNLLRSATTSLKLQSDEVVQKIDYFAKVATANIKAGLIQTTNFITENIVATQAFISNLRTDFLTSNQIVSPLVEADDLIVKDSFVSPLVETQRLTTNSLYGVAAEVKQATISSLLADSIENQKLETESLEALNATVSSLTSEEIRAGKIFAEEIVGASVAANYITNITNISNVYEATPSAIEDVDVDALIAELTNQGLNIGPFVDIATLSAQLAFVQSDFKVLGRSSLATTSVAGTLTQDGTLVFEEGNQINVLNGDLYLQKGGLGGVNIADGKVVISKEGNLLVSGDITIKGKFIIKNADDLEVASIDASGSATAKEVKIIRQVQADNSPEEIVADSSAGTGQIKAYHHQVFIKTSYAHASSLIYLTPVGSTNNKIIFLANIKPEIGFTVALDNPINKDIKFNWWIIN